MGKLDRAHTGPKNAAGDDSGALGGGPGDHHRLDPTCRSAHVPRRVMLTASRTESLLPEPSWRTASDGSFRGGTISHLMAAALPDVEAFVMGTLIYVLSQQVGAAEFEPVTSR